MVILNVCPFIQPMNNKSVNML